MTLDFVCVAITGGQQKQFGFNSVSLAIQC